MLSVDRFENFLRFYTYSIFNFEFISKCYIRSHKLYFSQNIKTDTSGKFFFSTFVSSMPVNLNQYRETVVVFNNRNMLSVIYGIANHFATVVLLYFLMKCFLCAAYLLTLLESLKSSFLISLRVKFHTIHTCLNLILYIAILLLYSNHFWFTKLS